MANITFKNFLNYLSTDDMTDSQITEIFGLFKNNSKLEKAKAEKEKLKAAKDARGKEIDKALQAMKGGKRPGVISNDDLNDVLDAGDRKAVFRNDRLKY